MFWGVRTHSFCLSRPPRSKSRMFENTVMHTVVFIPNLRFLKLAYGCSEGLGAFRFFFKNHYFREAHVQNRPLGDKIRFFICSEKSV